MKRFAAVLIVTVMATSLGACMFHGGEPKHVSTTTLGQELSDLKLALENGAITQPEYRAMKEELMGSEKCEGHDHHKHH